MNPIRGYTDLILESRLPEKVAAMGNEFVALLIVWHVS